MRYLLALLLLFLFNVPELPAQRLMEKLDRGLVAVRHHTDSAFISWRMLGTDPPDIAFNLYRYEGTGPFQKLNRAPLTEATCYTDAPTGFSRTVQYCVTSVLNGQEQVDSAFYRLGAATPVQQYLSVPLQVPDPGEVMGESYAYSANDASAADLDGDGQYEIILKWEPSNAKDSPRPGFSGPVILDAYKTDGTLLWRINLGKNIRAGAAYTQFMVYDLDGDGRAEMVCKTADGTMDGTGKVIGDADKDWRSLEPGTRLTGKVLDGPEYLTVFDGLTGAALATEEYIPSRYPLDGWGGIGGNGNNDSTGGRADRFSACVAYLDGKLPSAVMIRGWYGRTVAAAWDWRDGKLRQRWVFDSALPEWEGYSGMANHSVTVGDFDGDGKDEVCVGAMTIDDNGQGLYTTGLRHGDALHAGDLDPERPGLEVFGIHENEGWTVKLQTPGVAQFDAATGEILFSLGPGVDVGRGVAADIDPRYPGCENWGGPGGLRDVKGNTISEKTPSSVNFVAWWDGDLTRELLDKNHISKWDWMNERTERLLTAEGCVSNNGTKATPCLSADLFGDWREEVIWRTPDSRELRIYTTAIPTMYRFPTLMHDPQYRLAIAWQNAAYNQPPHPGFFLGAGMEYPRE